MDPAAALTEKSPADERNPAATAPEAAAWIANPTQAARRLTPGEQLAAEVARGDQWDQSGAWQGQGPEPPKDTTP